jgi:hypothetical protein
MRSSSLWGLLLFGPASMQASLFPPRGFAGFNSEQQNVFYTACLRPESCKLPLLPPSCRSSFAALSCSCFKVLVICDELLRSKVVDYGGVFRLVVYLRILISSITQPHPSIQLPINYSPCLHAVIVKNMHCKCVTCPSSIPGYDLTASPPAYTGTGRASTHGI